VFKKSFLPVYEESGEILERVRVNGECAEILKKKKLLKVILREERLREGV
jgi:hypothetical protein